MQQTPLISDAGNQGRLMFYRLSSSITPRVMLFALGTAASSS